MTSDFGFVLDSLDEDDDEDDDEKTYRLAI
jgi:hypothetical protein